MGIGASKTVEADRSAVAAAAAGVPGPGALALDAEARRAARFVEFRGMGGARLFGMERLSDMMA